MQSKNKVKNKTPKPQTVVSRTKNSLVVLEKREKHINELIAKVQKRIEELSKGGKDVELKTMELQILKVKQKQIVQKKESLLSEIRSIVAAFSTIPAETLA
jgi:F0F1-type ATP synthase membrane subunit b/b'